MAWAGGFGALARLRRALGALQSAAGRYACWPVCCGGRGQTHRNAGRLGGKSFEEVDLQSGSHGCCAVGVTDTWPAQRAAMLPIMTPGIESVQTILANGYSLVD
jgi:hypothetical protein